MTKLFIPTHDFVANYLNPNFVVKYPNQPPTKTAATPYEITKLRAALENPLFEAEVEKMEREKRILEHQFLLDQIRIKFLEGQVDHLEDLRRGAQEKIPYPTSLEKDRVVVESGEWCSEVSKVCTESEKVFHPNRSGETQANVSASFLSRIFDFFRVIIASLQIFFSEENLEQKKADLEAKVEEHYSKIAKIEKKNIQLQFQISNSKDYAEYLKKRIVDLGGEVKSL